MSIRILTLLCCALFAGAAAAEPVEVLVKPCAECHGTAGVSVAPKTPHLNGQLVEYLQQEIGVRAKSRQVTSVPDHVPPSWRAPEIVAVAKFYAESKATRPLQTTDAQAVAKGALIHQKRCDNCHQDSGRQSDHDAPLVAAQNLDYMIEQTKAFVSGKRKFPFQMDDAYRGLSAEDLDAVAHFFASQPQYSK